MKPPRPPLNQHRLLTSSPQNNHKSSLDRLISCLFTQNNDFGYTQLPNPSNQPKPTFQEIHNREFLTTLLLNSSNIPKPTIKTTVFTPRSPIFILTRSFSTAPSDQSSNAIPVVSTITSPTEASPPIDAGSSIRKPISLWPGMYHSPVTNALWEARKNYFERMSSVRSDAPSKSELMTRTPSQSRTSILYKFSSDYILREQYRNPWNEIRMGKLLEDLDALAGTISLKHCSNDDSMTRPLLLVTASVDKMVLKKPISVDTDLKIVGAVTWVGRSSLEIQLEVTQAKQGTEHYSYTPSCDSVSQLQLNRISICFPRQLHSGPLSCQYSKPGRFILVLSDLDDLVALSSFPPLDLHIETCDHSDPVALVANFTFVARDSATGKSAPVNRISPETDVERLLWEEAEERNKMRKMKKGKQKATEGERDRVNELLSEGRIFCDMPALADRDSILIRDTCLQNSLMCQPQQRNIHGRIFGGFLMRRAFELAFATAYAFAGSAPSFLEVDHVDFLKPVDVGNFLRLKSCVLYTELENPSQPLINVEVVAHVTRPELRSSEVSNKFYFTFSVRSEAMMNGLKIRNVVPATEEEARRVIERKDAESS
ncbi:hypothetical protein RJ640_027477 [Escallonia rubra]|uniref:HotDog ACOT-type domain-containing protein n=1 Tax=Escallonia rubra TaxID=112253 RepID=A0AA88R7M4_9ASTE|nr:hypothetical protein RJ640_027477 [Escallonia rubra]